MRRVLDEPDREPAAPVNAPRAWPNSSFSSSDSVQRRAVQRHERLGRARTAGVNGAGRQLFARSGLAGDEHGAGRGRGAADQFFGFLYRRALADERVERAGRLNLALEQAAPDARAGGGRPRPAPA